MNITLATCRDLLDLTPSDRLLAAALEARGATVRAAAWDALAAEPAREGLVCVRSTWDYFTRAEEFRSWIESFTDRPRLLLNPPETILWNFDKRYLRDLESLGVPIPETRWLEPGDSAGLSALFGDTGWERAVLKPRISGGAHGTYALGDGAMPDSARLEPVRASGGLLQEFVPEIQTEGEMSLMYLDGAFSHAVRKRPAAGDFRVQLHLGGAVEGADASPALRAFGERVLEAAGRPWIYARVDVVERANGPVLMELEVIEPDLYLTTAPHRAGTLAQALIASHPLS